MHKGENLSTYVHLQCMYMYTCMHVIIILKTLIGCARKNELQPAIFNWPGFNIMTK